MATVQVSRAPLEISKSIVHSLFGSFRDIPFAIRYWDGSEWRSQLESAPLFTVVLKHPGALRQMLLNPSDLTLGEAYIYDDFDIEGDIIAVMPIADRLMEHRFSPIEQARFAAQLLSLPNGVNITQATEGAQLHGRVHSRGRDRQAISYHYDRSNEFYRLFLDRQMVYSCAYFPTPETSLDDAQTAKLDYICRKLRLRPGETLLDIGCGWGGLVMHAVRHYGVKALGITLSTNQATYAREQIAAAGLGDQCQVEILDYRDVQAPRGGFDKIVSVGMFEHVGSARLRTYFDRVWHLLRPGGVFLNHGIALNSHVSWAKVKSFITTYVFPDGELMPISTTLTAAEAAGFEVRDVESLREHYALTLRHWVHNLETHQAEARQNTDELTYRVWRLYMAGSSHAFVTGHNNLYQSLLLKPYTNGASGLPIHRDDWYRQA